MQRFTFIFVLLFSTFTLKAQTVFYLQSRIIQNDTDIMDVSGGQFITFTEGLVYESDKNGFQVNKSRLEFFKEVNGITFYKGNSYWGPNTIFAFNNDKSTMNVISSDGTKYVYKRSDAPANLTTCSLIINEGGSSSTSISASEKTTISNQISSNNYFLNNGEQRYYQIDNKTGTKTAKVKETQYKEKCFACNGKGRVEKNFTVSTFGNNEKVWCSECKSYHYESNGHYHVNCEYCKGTGYIVRTKYEAVYE